MGARREGLSRRDALGRIAVTLGVAAGLAALPMRLLRGSRRPEASPLPGEGSIFQPRQDARLREWLKRNSA